MRHVSVAAAPTHLVTGEETNGRYCLIDMLVPPGGGPRRTVTTSRRFHDPGSVKSS